MKIIENAYATLDGAYYESGGLIEGTQRIPTNHPMPYWQQGNVENFLGIQKDSIKSPIKIDAALYVGRIPTHFGHFLLEGLPRLCDAPIMNIPIVGYVTDGFLPNGIKATPRESIDWIINTVVSKKFYTINEHTAFIVGKLYVPKLPIILSHSCPEPWRMSTIIEKIVKAARNKNKETPKEIDSLTLRTLNEKLDNTKEYSNPNSHISKQIAKVSYAKNLFGLTGSNTHISMFAQKNCRTHWEQRGDFNQTDRNQLICDLVKTYNKF